MGYRANVCVKGDDGVVFLYTHWSGRELPAIVGRALARRQRWGDAAYLRRIIFCEMIKGREADETGYGISPGLCDNEYDVLVVDVENETVGLAKEETPDQPYAVVSFKSFIDNPARHSIAGKTEEEYEEMIDNE